MGSGRLTAEDASRRLEARLVGDAAFLIEGVASPETATEHLACFIESERYLSDFSASSARCWLITPGIFDGLDGSLKKQRTYLVTERPYHAFVKLVGLFFPALKSNGKRHAPISIDPTAEVHPSAQIEAFVSVGAKARVGANVILHAGVWIGDGAEIGDDSILYGGARVYSGCVVGKRNTLHAGAVVGSDGFGFLPDAKGLVKIPQVGRAILHDDVEVGANSTIDRGTVGDTIVGQGTKIDNLVQVGHNCKIGKNCILCAYVGLSGNTVLGNGVLMAGKSATKGHLTVGDNVRVGAQSGVSKDIPPNQQVKGYPALPVKEFLKLQVLFTKLPEIYKRLTDVKKKLKSPAKNKEVPL